VLSDSEYLENSYTMKDIRGCIVNLDDTSPILRFYFNRSDYYNALGHDDAVYKVYKYYLSNTDKIPNYALVIADEYQDFNKLESSFIALLASKNKTLIAGDDDQAVYGFRFASTEYIRGLFNNTVYKHFNLPYSTRCTEVMVNTVNNFISQVQNQGHLSGRISEKEYKSYWPDKYMLNDKYPNIPVIDCTSYGTAMAYVKDHILKITADEAHNGEETDTQFLVIGAESGHRLKSLEEYLTKNLDSEVYEVIPAKSSDAPNDINEGYRLLYANPTSNLGWRIVLEYDSVTNIAGVIKETYETGTVLHPLLPDEYLRKHLEKANEIFSAAGNPTEANLVVNKPRIKVKLVNSLGSKGLSALHVIIYEFHNKVLPRDVNNIEDDDISRCLVAMTRAKNSCVFIAFKEFNRTSGHSENMKSIFLKMLPQDLLGNKKYRIQNGKLVEI